MFLLTIIEGAWLIISTNTLFANDGTQQIVGRESRCIGMFRKMTGPAMVE
jgi:hypothetical protein